MLVKSSCASILFLLLLCPFASHLLPPPLSSPHSFSSSLPPTVLPILYSFIACSPSLLTHTAHITPPHPPQLEQATSILMNRSISIAACLSPAYTTLTGIAIETTAVSTLRTAGTGVAIDPPTG